MQEPFRITYAELFPYIVAVNAAFGVLFGSFPLVAGVLAGNRKYGIFGFVASVIGGAVLGVLISFPAAIIFLWLILRKSEAQRTGAETPATDSENTLV
ncbi:MAG: hypothetical protein ABI539_01140 [Acidobacteriota bacterium]